MCGIAGFLDFSKESSYDLMQQQISRMIASLYHRGPDDGGVWLQPNDGIALGMRRLAIQDLSLAGHQPMVSSNGRYIIVYNGEVYNADDLREKLVRKGISFRGHSDTEVILEACNQWGVKDTASQLIGMFAFALWDQLNKQLILVRDRLGIKPLYFGKVGSLLLFGSELKAFVNHGKANLNINNDALTYYFKYNFIPAPYTIYNNISKMLPGTVITFDSTGKSKREIFWNPLTIIEQGLKSREQKEYSDKDLIDELEALLKDAIQRRMITDVPLGAFLSGGIDSSTVTAIMQKFSTNPIKTYSIGFQEESFNEIHYARSIAQYLKTDHHEYILSSKESLSFIPQIPDFFDEPFADVSQIPTYFISKIARQSVTVALSGDGGDELFGGYNRHYIAARMQFAFNILPLPLRSIIAKSLKLPGQRFWDNLVPSSFVPQAGDKIYKFANALKAKDVTELYEVFLSQGLSGYESVLLGSNNLEIPSNAVFPKFMDSIQYWDLTRYLPDDILTKLDRASMAVSLEARVPLLDHRIVAFAWALPHHMKIRNGTTKWILREVLYRYIPKELYNRPKMGFGVPIAKWLRGPLKEWADELLLPERLKETELYDVKKIQTLWQHHLRGNQDHHHQLWAVLMYEAWREKKKDIHQ